MAKECISVMSDKGNFESEKERTMHCLTKNLPQRLAQLTSGIPGGIGC
jgi:hypothetical protein